MSVPPPGGNGITSVIARAGQRSCANVAGEAAANIKQTAAMPRHDSPDSKTLLTMRGMRDSSER